MNATKSIAEAETAERKAVAQADVGLAKDLQAAWGTYAAAECSAVIRNANVSVGGAASLETSVRRGRFRRRWWEATGFL